MQARALYIARGQPTLTQKAWPSGGRSTDSASTLAFAVEIVVAGDLGAMLAQMRSWLDHHRIEIAGFHQLSDKRGVIVRMEFAGQADAAACAALFGGQLAPIALDASRTSTTARQLRPRR